ncbi:MAG: NADH-quinone oxidoreductase subunit M [Bacteroidales bacterium]|nr:NADH-quinone oxidoreductase subunit M [Bacteroidales bacterium]
MILIDLIIVLLIGAILAWITGKWNSVLPRIISLAALVVDLFLIIPEVVGAATNQTKWLVDIDLSWIPAFGINLHLALDGLSLMMLLLTFFMGIVSVIISWKEINKRVGFFHFNLLMTLTGVVGVFLSLDLFLFYFFWELMLVPLYFMIGIWGHKNSTAVAYKFFLYTQAGGLLMLISILALYFIHGQTTGVYTFDYLQLIGTKMPASVAFLLMLGFLAAFLVKLPMIPLHTWLTEVYSEAPTAVLLSALLLKTGAYGLFRFVVPLFPFAARSFAPVGMVLGVIAILYGAKLAFAQTDLKRLIAYISVSHVGFILLGIFAFNEIAYQGVVMQMLTQGISTGALLIMAEQLSERLHTRDINQMGGLWEKVPIMGTIGLIFTMASLGLPGFGNFIAELLVLLGVFKTNVTAAVLASLGLVAAAIYSLRILQKVFYGRKSKNWEIHDLSIREKLVAGSMIIIIVGMGLFPKPVLNIAKPVVLKSLNTQNDSAFLKSQESKTKVMAENTCFLKPLNR